MTDRSPEDGESAIADTPVADGTNHAEGSSAVTARRTKGPRQIRSGDTLGRYEIGDELGEGGMAMVFRARDRELRRDVAVKVLFPHLVRRPDVVRRFHREARTAACLEHPNILRIYDVGGAEGDDPPYIVMELIRGRTLLQEIEQRGAMLAEIVACIGALLADALAAAHSAGVIHRDVKPANVLIAPGGRLLLGDFGVARLETQDSLVTRTGALLGTPAYMSPEQASGDIATARSDLYSLGATLYQLATGALPYTGSPAKVMSLIAAGNLVAPVRRRSSCGVDLSRLIERLLAVDPSARPEHATVIAAELRALASEGGLGDATEELAAYFEDPDGFLRTRTPTVVAALVAAANTAVAQARLPRAMALADRASSLAPTEPTVTALVEAVTSGGRAASRNRQLAAGGLALAVAGIAIGSVWRLSAASPVADPRDGLPGSAAQLAREDTAGPAVDDDALARRDLLAPVAPGDAATPSVVTAPDDAAISAIVAAPGDAAAAGAGSEPSAGSAANRDARVRPQPPRAAPIARKPSTAPVAVARRVVTSPPVGSAPPSADAPPGPPMALNPAPPSSVETPGTGVPPDAQKPADRVAHLIVRNDVWCNIWVDQVNRGNRRNELIEITAGHHVVTCENPPVGKWTREVEIAPDTTRTITGTLLRDLTVTLAVDGTINGKYYARGTVANLKPGVVEVVAGGKKQFITLRASCTVRDSPELGCY